MGRPDHGLQRGELHDWPISRAELEGDYRAILSKIPYSAEADDLAEYHPLWADADPLPPLSENSNRILERYRRHRTSVRRHGVIVAKSRLALKGSSCVSCGPVHDWLPVLPTSIRRRRPSIS